MHGAAVRRFQELTDLIGINLGPNDGVFGPDTEAEVCTLQRHTGLKVDGVCGPQTWKLLLDKVDQKSEPSKPSGLIDIRGKHDRPKLYKCRREPLDVCGVTLHQTGCEMPKTAMGWRRLNAHIGVTQEGLAIIVNDPLDWIWHAQGLSRRTIGIEIEGNYPGLVDNPKTLWRGGGGPNSLNPDMLSALGVVFNWLTDWFDDNGANLEYVFGHRQSKDTRIADPGQEIWQQVAIPWMTEMAATDGGDEYYLGSGRPIPNEWAADGRDAEYFY